MVVIDYKYMLNYWCTNDKSYVMTLFKHDSIKLKEEDANFFMIKQKINEKLNLKEKNDKTIVGLKLIKFTIYI